MARKLDAYGENQGKVWEGLPGTNGKPALTAYLDSAGNPTNGWGHRDGVKMGTTITIEEAEANYQADLAPCCECVEESIKAPLNDHQFAALVLLTLNIGVAAFKSSTVVKVLNQTPPNYQAVPAAMALWNEITDPVTKKKVISDGLVNRRALETVLWLLPVDAMKSPIVSPPSATTPTLTQSDLRQVNTSNATPNAPPTSAIQTPTGIAAVIGGVSAAAQPIIEASNHAADVRNAVANAIGDRATNSEVWLIVSTALVAVMIASSVYVYWRTHRKLIGAVK